MTRISEKIKRDRLNVIRHILSRIWNFLLKKRLRIPPKFFLGWKMDTIEFIQDVILHEINKNDVELKSSENGVKYCKIETVKYENDNLVEKPGIDIKEMINEDNIEKISEERGISTGIIYQKGKDLIIEYNNIISKEVGLFLYLTELKRKAPLCRHIKIDGTRCQNKVRHHSKYCYQHR